MKNLANIRNEYQLKELSIKKVNSNPVKQFEIWLNEAIESKVIEPTAMILATASKNNLPSQRVVLLKGIENNCLHFFSNYKSKKGVEIKDNPCVSVLFFWAELERQVRIEGEVFKLTKEISDNYFKSRPKGSKIGAWVSPQSNEISSREFLENLQLNFETKNKGKEIKRPENWGGYGIKPSYFEFWQGRKNRLHDRICYKKDNENWRIFRLAP